MVNSWLIHQGRHRYHLNHLFHYYLYYPGLGVRFAEQDFLLLRPSLQILHPPRLHHYLHYPRRLHCPHYHQGTFGQ